MSSDSLAALRKSAGPELTKLAEEHLKHDLRQSDRDALQSAASKLSTHATIGTIVGLGLGFFLAARIRASRTRMFNVFKAMEKPTQVSFADGRTEALPDLAPFIKPSPLGDIFTYMFFGAGGLFIGGETGLLTGTLSANRTIASDPESKKRIENAFRRFRAEVLRKQAEELEKGTENLDILS
ncbi:hypothetical protein NA57DRAFT_71886 [Rhizodiscina lignyota]|uniref:Uncharacterized protein n=1 Tax=Rhizodiscina lignyota TaxID=1504668 RepID=A0A9P4IQY8_9PEZI|nr:hypothetical protein NA57DRAFT_71886 [Rhizodiscina lignyota]